MNIKVSNLFAQTKTPKELDEMLNNLFGKGTPERASAELVKGLTVNLISSMSKCDNCELRVSAPHYCKPCVDVYHHERFGFAWSKSMGPRDSSVDAALREKGLID